MAALSVALRLRPKPRSRAQRTQQALQASDRERQPRQRPRSAPPRLAARRSRSRRPRRLDALRTAKGDSAPGRAIARRIELRSEQARIGRFSLHVLRRTSVTQVLDQGVDVATVADLMGHASLDTTRRYDRRGEQTKGTPWQPSPYPTPGQGRGRPRTPAPAGEDRAAGALQTSGESTPRRMGRIARARATLGGCAAPTPHRFMTFAPVCR